MKRLTCLIVVGVLVALSGAAGAEVPKDEKNLERESSRLNDTASIADGERAVVRRIMAEFKTTEARVQSLRERKLGYGEIAVVLSLAQKMPDGATDANVQKVISLRQGPPVMGWGQVARHLGAKLGPAVSQIKKMNNEARREIKKDHAQTGKAGKPAQKDEPQEKQAAPKQDLYKDNGKSLNRGRAD